MEHYVLAILDSQPMLEKAQAEWKKYQIGVHGVKDVQAAIKELPNKSYVMITLIADYLGDFMLDALRVIRSVSAIPILVLTSTYHPQEQIAAIKLGADLYIALPETTEEYVIAGMALVRRHLAVNRNIPPPPLMMEHSGLLLCVDYFRVFVYGKEIELTPKEYDILLLLLEHRHRVITYSQIYRRLWGDEYMNDSQRVINNLVSKLKRKLQVVSVAPEYIKNIHGVGYSFNPDP